MRNKLYFLNDVLVFIFIFSLFNDLFLTNLFGNNILKAIFIIFVTFNGKMMINNFKKMHSLQNYLFFFFFLVLTVMFLIGSLINMPDDLIAPVFTLLSVLLIVVYFSRYSLDKLFYLIWVVVMISITICFFNDPIDTTTFRKTGGTPDPNTFATQVLTFILISIYLFNKNKNRFFLIISTIFFLYGIFFAGSKSAFLTLGVIIVLVVFKYLFYNLKTFFGYKFILLLTILLIAATQIDFTKIEIVSNILDRTESNKTAHFRFISWVAGQHMIEENPLMGVGLGQFNLHTHKYAEVIHRSTAPHNTYIQLFAEMGIIVFSVFLLLLSVLLTSNFRLVINSNFIWVYFSFVAILFMGLTLGLAYWKVQWLFIAIMMNINYIIKDQKGSS